MSKPTAPKRHAFTQFETLALRWQDNDIYGHVNNAVYYQLFDTAVNGFLLRQGALDFAQSAGVFLVVANSCDYFSEFRFPDHIVAGLRIARLGRSSVTYEIGLFRNDDDDAAALGRFVHVYVGRQDRKPVAIPGAVREILDVLAR